MAKRRSRNPEPLRRLKEAHEARVRRTADLVEEGSLALVNVVPELIPFVAEELDRRTKGGRISMVSASGRGI